MTDPATPPPHRRARIAVLCSIALLAVAGSVLGVQMRRARLEQRLLSSDPQQAVADPALQRFAVAQAKPLYAANCAACHGADLKGNMVLGAPNLTDRVWLYGSGRVFDIERTVLYGVRSGLSKAHDVTDMPAYGLNGTLSAAEIQSLVQYVLQLSGRAHDGLDANAGKALYFGKGGCFDCHGADARGNPDYGSPDLTANVWNSGGDSQALYQAIYSGQHHLMPGWIGTLSLEQVRALAVYIYLASHG